jgi:hypothetical protein
MKMKINPLINKTILSMQIADDKMSLKFTTNEGVLIAECDADCCSNTWIEHIELPALGFPAQIISVCDLQMPDLGDMPDCDVVSYYGFKIITDKGDIVIDYRNNSNGYYGGDLRFDKAEHYGGVFSQNQSSYNFVDIEE